MDTQELIMKVAQMFQDQSSRTQEEPSKASRLNLDEAEAKATMLSDSQVGQNLLQRARSNRKK